MTVIRNKRNKRNYRNERGASKVAGAPTEICKVSVSDTAIRARRDSEAADFRVPSEFPSESSWTANPLIWERMPDSVSREISQKRGQKSCPRFR